ncbi:CLUMA_CG003924, isoform A [Clunio marinus]|uniref:CLUMA_CG003924, isoform A n=1 Tax=Clunio marinus TaxID=568069 RepID=A0A1J1HRQ7_9DIPT|nr:CLUMA_CG003924, isoform A [Clunio marinus]
MSVTLFLCWLNIVTMLSTVVLVTDSCSSTFGSRKTKRIIEASSPALTTKTVTIPSTTLLRDTTKLTEPKETIVAQETDKTFKFEGYRHEIACGGQYQMDFCLNGGTCYIHKYRDASLYFCKCPSYFHGHRCQEKQLEGSYGGGKVGIRRSRIRRQISQSEKKLRTGHRGHHLHQRTHKNVTTTRIP